MGNCRVTHGNDSAGCVGVNPDENKRQQGLYLKVKRLYELQIVALRNVR